MKIQQEHLTAIKSFGYTEREARFLYAVAIHSGYFTQTHLRQFSGNRSGRTGYDSDLDRYDLCPIFSMQV